MNSLDRSYKRLMKDSREYLSDIVKKYNRASTNKERAWRVLLTYRHFFQIASRLIMLHGDFEKEESDKDKK